MKTLKEFQKLGGFQGIGALRRSSGTTTVVMYLENEFIKNKYSHDWDFDISS